IAAGDRHIVVADVGRGVGGAGAVDVDVGLAFVISLDGLVEGGDARLALGVDAEANVFIGLAVLDGEGDALVFLDEVSGGDRLGGDGQLGFFSRSGGLFGLILGDGEVLSRGVGFGLLVDAPDGVVAGRKCFVALELQGGGDLSFVVGFDLLGRERRRRVAADDGDLAVRGEALAGDLYAV